MNRPLGCAREPWYAGPIHALGLLARLLVFVVLLILTPIAGVVAARPLGLLAQVVIAVPLGLVALVSSIFFLAVFAALCGIEIEGFEDLDRTHRGPCVPAWNVVSVWPYGSTHETSMWVSARHWTATPEASMGGWLRREREERRVSLADITAKTQIHAKYLRAIEDDRFDLLPGGLLRRSFLRQYAEQVGLMPATVVALFDDYVHGRMATAGSPVAQLIAPSSIPANSAVGALKVEVVPSKAPASHRAAKTVFGVIEAAVPKRLADEELGDALEYIAAQPAGWRPWVKIVSTAIWLTANYLRELLGRKGR